MPSVRRHLPLFRAMALGAAVLWGLVEFLALCRTRLPLPRGR